VYADGVEVDYEDYTLHAAANLLTDAQAEASDENDYTQSGGTNADMLGMSRDGGSCVKVTPTGGTKPSILTGSKTTGIVVGDLYTALIALFATASSSQNYNAQIKWYTAANALVSTTQGPIVAVAPGAWVVRYMTAAAPATTAKAIVSLRRNDSSGTDDFYADCFALNPGDYDVWHLPSQSPGLIEFDTAPASGARVSVTATGRYLARCRLDPASMQWSYNDNDRAQVRTVRAFECLEF